MEWFAVFVVIVFFLGIGIVTRDAIKKRQQTLTINRCVRCR